MENVTVTFSNNLTFYDDSQQNFKAIQAAYLSGLLYQHMQTVDPSAELLQKIVQSWTFIAMQLLLVESVELTEWVLCKLRPMKEKLLDDVTMLKIDLVEVGCLIQKGEVSPSFLL